MPLRAFIDSDEGYTAAQDGQLGDVLMPLRAFIDSDIDNPIHVPLHMAQS